MSLHKSLTIEQKIGIIKYEIGAFALLSISHYEDVKNAPEPDPKPYRLYLSSLLGIDYDEDVLKNSSVNDFCRKLTKKDRDFIGMKDWHIADALSNCMWNFIKENEDRRVDEAFLAKMDNEIVDLWKAFNSYKEEKSYTYEPFIVVNGEQMYRRVRK